MLWQCYKLPSGVFGNTRDTSVMHEKAKFVCFNYMQPQKVKFKSVQINMKHVSYYSCKDQLGYTLIGLKFEKNQTSLTCFMYVSQDGHQKAKMIQDGL